MEPAPTTTTTRKPGPPVSPARAEALALGLPTYVGNPCKRAGHTLRYTKTQACVACKTERTRRDQKANPERWRAYYRRWARKNPARYAAHNAWNRHPQRKPGCIPPGTSFEDTVPLYAERIRRTKETGVEHHVDHVTALHLGGPHAVGNLQVLPKPVHAEKTRQERRRKARRARQTPFGTS